jgi:signal transduction histidine kinase/CheY-like chemotaxis protein
MRRMNIDPSGDGEERILILAPTGRDGEVLRLVLGRAGLAARICDSIDAAVAELEGPTGTGALVLAEEALISGAERLVEWVARQPPWCDLPLLVLRSDLAQWDNRSSAAAAFEKLGNVSLLERPLRSETLISAVRSALRARRRQYQMRAHLCERQEAEARLRELNATLEERVARAVAERRQAEAALIQAQKIEALGRLTGGVAHDFNNLLTAIVGNLELLQSRLPSNDTDGHRLADAAIRSAERAARLTQQLLAFGRKQTLQLRAVDVNRVIGGMDEMLRRTIGSPTLIETRFAPDLWPAQVDEDQLVLSVLNLALNARDAMPAGGTLRIETANVPAGTPDQPGDLDTGDFVRVSVVDSGTGISPDVLGKVFEPFFTTKQHGKGTGLGLSQVYGLAKQVGGTVAIKTRVGRGTEVHVYLPRADGVEAADEQTRRLPPANGHSAADHRIVLIVDDDPEVRRVTAEYLEHTGFTVFEAESGSKALELLDGGGRIDLLLVDFAMPEMDGAELLRRVRQIRPGLPALMVTGYIKDRASLDALDVAVLHKPFPLAVLGARIHELLGLLHNRPGPRTGAVA